MSTSEEKALPAAAPDGASSQIGDAPAAAEAPAEAAAGPQHTGGVADPTPDPHEALSPAVRRLVRQFDLDITGIHGTGPEGRIRVGDVMGLLNGRTDSGKRDAPARAVAAEDDPQAEAASELEPVLAAAPDAAPAPASTVFDCDLSRVLAHRKKLRLGDVELLTTSYFLTALAAALDSTPEITAGHAARFGVSMTTSNGELRSAFLDTAAISWDSALGERVRAIDAALRANLDADVSAANLLVHHYGESGSVLATPTPIGRRHEASAGIGRVRREIVVRTFDGVESPRIAARCFVSLSFFPERVPLHHANRCMAEVVRILETWPE
jgi:pyruvate/2-oxoglutarate dehydrogenase complex dihydrolipoamide acyltransferase (E2) component